MMQTGFIVSPLVENTREFIFLSTGNQDLLKNKNVVRLVLTPVYGGSVFWESSMRVKLSTNRTTIKTGLPDGFYDPQVDTPSASGGVLITQCEFSVDAINGVTPTPEKVKSSPLLMVEGWSAISGANGVIPETTYIVLENSRGIKQYVKTRPTARSDVKAYFHHPEMPDIGFTATLDGSGLSGQYRIGIAQSYQGTLRQCSQVKTIMLGV